MNGSIVRVVHVTVLYVDPTAPYEPGTDDEWRIVLDLEGLAHGIPHALGDERRIVIARDQGHRSALHQALPDRIAYARLRAQDGREAASSLFGGRLHRETEGVSGANELCSRVATEHHSKRSGSSALARRFEVQVGNNDDRARGRRARRTVQPTSTCGVFDRGQQNLLSFKGSDVYSFVPCDEPHASPECRSLSRNGSRRGARFTGQRLAPASF